MVPLQSNNVLELHKWRHQIDLSPPYQRLSIWDTKKRQTFIDSIINGFDVPKLYFHEILRADSHYRYAVIDGKQRLQSLWEFMSNIFPLSDDFVFFDDERLHAAGSTYDVLMREFPRLRARFDDFEVPVTVVQVDDDDFIEKLFVRLNIQVPLSAPERRNALGGPLPFLIRKIGVGDFFRVSSALPNNRLQHFDVAAKFLYLTHVNAIASTKRETLDNFVEAFRDYRDQDKPEASEKSLNELQQRTEAVLVDMYHFFSKRDPLLSSQGRIVLYFHLFRIHRDLGMPVQADREMLEQFNEAVTIARRKSYRRGVGSQEELSSLEQDVLVPFDKEKQSLNDAAAIERQYRYLADYFLETFDVTLPLPP
jgi:hypothetical protein